MSGEMSLAAWVMQLPEGHKAKNEYLALLFAKDRTKLLEDELVKLEWSFNSMVRSDGEMCPACRKDKRFGHSEFCGIGKALDRRV